MSEFKDCRAAYAQRGGNQIEFHNCSLVSNKSILVVGTDRLCSIKNGKCLSYDATQDSFDEVFPFTPLTCNSRPINCAYMPEMQLVFFIFGDGSLACGDPLEPLKPAASLGYVKHRKNYFDNQMRRVAVMNSSLVLLTGKSDVEIIQITHRNPVQFISFDYRIHQEIIRVEARGKELVGISPTCLLLLFLKNGKVCQRKKKRFFYVKSRDRTIREFSCTGLLVYLLTKYVLHILDKNTLDHLKQHPMSDQISRYVNGMKAIRCGGLEIILLHQLNGGLIGLAFLANRKVMSIFQHDNVFLKPRHSKSAINQLMYDEETGSLYILGQYGLFRSAVLRI